MSTDVIAELERSEPKAFEGDLTVLPLPELMQFLHIGAKGGVLGVHDASGRPRAGHGLRGVRVALYTADLVVDRRDDSFLDAIIPRMLRQDEVRTTRYAPPTLVVNLLLKRCDGKRTLRVLMTDLSMDEREFLDEVKLLVRTHWLAFAGGADVFHRVAAG